MPQQFNKALLRDAACAFSLSLNALWDRLVTACLCGAGILIILLACWGVDSLMRLSTVSFPASVACMILLFFSLAGCEACVGNKKTRRVVRIIDVPAGFALRWINVFFTPSFILLPLSSSIGGMEIGKIIAVFTIGFVLMLSITSYMVRTLQLLLGSSKRAMEETRSPPDNQDSMPLTNLSEPSRNTSTSTTPTDSLLGPPEDEILPSAPAPAAEPARVQGPGPEVSFSRISETHVLLQQDVPLSRGQMWAALLVRYIDVVIWGMLFLVSLPILYTIGYSMPAQLSLNVLSYLLAFSLPPRIKRILHPVLGCSLLTVFLTYLLSLSRGLSLTSGLEEYSTKTRYLALFRGQGSSLPLPGAGDIFASILDASIVALALPMFQYRHELKRHFISIGIPAVGLAVASLFAYPAICSSIGIEKQRSLSFAARSLTLALATPAISNLDGDLNLTAILCITSGIIGVLIGERILKLLKIPEDDYVTRGVSLGANSAAITTAHLLETDPRAAALSSLAMVLFGTSVVALTAVPAVVRIVWGLVGS